MIDFHAKAINKLVSNAQYVAINNVITTWADEREQPSEEAIQAKIKELEADFDAKKYQRDRKYPELGEQFDLLFKDIDSGKVNKDGGFYKAIKGVKDAHPKPE